MEDEKKKERKKTGEQQVVDRQNHARKKNAKSRARVKTDDVTIN